MYTTFRYWVEQYFYVNQSMTKTTYPREYLMNYRGPGYITRDMIWLLPHPLLLSPVSKLYLILSLLAFHRSGLPTGEGGGREGEG